jgi:hypothetical protein
MRNILPEEIYFKYESVLKGLVMMTLTETIHEVRLPQLWLLRRIVWDEFVENVYAFT